MLVRGIYYEGWNPAKVPRKMKADEFLESFVRQGGNATDWPAEQALRAATRVLLLHVTGGEALDVLNSLPADVRGLLL
jgi:uncharacterized protein (DUF2267 family)